jgi:GTP cyclohydrolase I
MEDNTAKLIPHVEAILKLLGVDLKDDNYKETPLRVAKLYKHFFRNHRSEVIADIKKKVFKSDHDQMVIVRDIVCFGMCPHHLLPVKYTMTLGYMPKGKVVGLSKLARLGIAIASLPKLQEDITREIADVMEEILRSKGVMVIINGLHGCMAYRGVEMEAITTTSECRGLFRKEGAVKAEFLELIKTK